jgi:hypothetical protein
MTKPIELTIRNPHFFTLASKDKFINTILERTAPHINSVGDVHRELPKFRKLFLVVHLERSQDRLRVAQEVQAVTLEFGYKVAS